MAGEEIGDEEGEGTDRPAGGLISRQLDRAKSLRQTLIGAFGFMVVAITVASAMNYLFNMVMGWMLPKSDFADLYSMLSVFLIVVTAGMSIQAVVTKYIAEFGAKGEEKKKHILVHAFSRWLIGVALVVIVASVLLAWPIAHLLHLKSLLYVIILGTSIAAAGFLTLPYGVLQGEQRFVGLGTANIAMATTRIVVGVALVGLWSYTALKTKWPTFGVSGALISGTVAGVLVAGVVIWRFKDLFKKPDVTGEEDFKPSHALRFLVPVVAAMFFIILISQMDILLVNAIPSLKAQAGNYSYAALAGKAVFYFPEGIILVMFPRVSEMRTKGERTHRVLLLSITGAALMVGAVAAFYALFPHFTMVVFSRGKGGQTVTSLVGLFGAAMAMYALVKLVAFYHLALERKGFILLFVVAAVAQVVGILLFHDSLRQVVMVMLVVGAALLAANLLLAFREEPGHDEALEYADPENLPVV